MKYENIIKSIRGKHKIYFGSLFVACVVVMFAYRIMMLFRNAPPILGMTVEFANSMFETFVLIFDVVDVLAASISAAIIFFYCIEFYNCKRLRIFYGSWLLSFEYIIETHIDVFKSCNIIKDDDLITDEDIFHRTKNVAFFLDYYMNHEMNSYIEEVITEGVSQGKETKLLLNDFSLYVEILEDKNDFHYFKNSKQYIDTIILWIRKLESELEKLNDYDVNKEAICQYISSCYVILLEITIDYYINLEKFITSIDRKQMLYFLRWVN